MCLRTVQYLTVFTAGRIVADSSHYKHDVKDTEVLFSNYEAQKVRLCFAHVRFLLHQIGGTSKGNTGWISDPGENSFH